MHIVEAEVHASLQLIQMICCCLHLSFVLGSSHMGSVWFSNISFMAQ